MITTNISQANGAKAVYILGRRAASLQKTADAAANGKIVPLVADITSQESLAAAAATVRATEGFVDAVIANSGVSAAEQSPYGLDGRIPPLSQVQSKLWSVPFDEFSRTFDVNVSGAFYTVVAFLDLLDAANQRPATVPARPKSQAIIMVSVSGFLRHPSPLASFGYVASKAGAIQMAKQLSTAFAQYKIRVNAVAPGIFPSEMTEPYLSGADIRLEGNLPAAICPLERSGGEDDIAGVTLFMISRAGAYLNGSVQVIDGGSLALYPASY